MKVKPQIVIAIVLVILAAGVGYAAFSGAWATNSSNGNGTGDGDGSGEGDAIRGSSTFAEISSQYGIPEEDMMSAFRVEGDGAETVTPGSLTEIYPDKEIGTGSVRLFVALYLGEEYDLTGDANLLEAGVQMLVERGALTTEQEQYLALHTVQVQ
jgi:hypothetical protein